nr:PREDICTED: pleckstrin homology domain-containing family H member 3 [Latimeria chalumnae]|eukprot:XP_014342722.1 PREDICTED: pleckstrin homology domain-containing family H member 3 [Latimeria chalumnae]
MPQCASQHCSNIHPKRPNGENFGIVFLGPFFEEVVGGACIRLSWYRIAAVGVLAELGWLHREIKGGVKTPWIRLRKHWFVLTQDSLDYYTSNEKNAKRLGTLVLTSLCSVIWPDRQTYKETGYWNITVYGRKHCYRLYTKHLNEAVHWVCAIQKVIDSKVPVETPTQLLIRDIEENSSNSEVVERIYKQNPILQYTQSPLYAPLLPFPYGNVDQTFNSMGYTTLRDEAVKIFNSLQQLEAEQDPVPLIQGILQTCHDLWPLRDEIYCQLIKQTSGSPHPSSQANLRYWQLLTCMSCTFLPNNTVLRYLRFHLERTQAQFPGTEIDKYAEFISKSLEKTKLRECVPSWEEILVLINRQEMLCTIHYPAGSGSCKIAINSHTTAEEVVMKMVGRLGLENSRNIFALYEQNNQLERAVGKTTIVADILTRFENLAGEEKNSDPQWRLIFKLYCFLDIDSVPKDSMEFMFLFEQAHEMVIRGYIPVTEETLQSLAALRLQFLNNDFTTHVPFPRLEELFPLHLLHSRILATTKAVLFSKSTSVKFHTSLLSGALPNGLWSNALHKQKAEEDQKFKGRMKEEGANMMSTIIDKWKLLQGMSREETMATYLAIVKEWPGFGSTLFEVDFYMSSAGSFSQRLWLGISANALLLYKQGDAEPFESFCYRQISSYGVSDGNTFKITVGEKDLLFETNKVDEIAQLVNTYLTSCSSRKPSRLQSESISDSLNQPVPELPSHQV